MNIRSVGKDPSESKETKTMTKAGIVNDVYERVGVTKKEASEYVEAVFSVLKQTLATGENVKISGFGKFEVHQKGNRMGRNPRTGVEIMIKERKVPRFKASQVLKNDLNQNKVKEKRVDN